MRKIIGLFIFLTIILTSPIYAADWFVRPSGGSYGSENGTSYANAWDGLENVVWGTNGVQAGDTLYVCGLHLRHYTSHPPGSLHWEIGSGTSSSRITIRGDYAGDPGIIWGAAVYDVHHWTSIGSNTYSQNLTKSIHEDWIFEDVTESSWKVLDRAESIQDCQNKAGSYFLYQTPDLDANKLYVHCSDNGNPYGRIAVNRMGYDIQINRVSYVDWLNIDFYCIYRWLDYGTPPGESVSHMKWIGCNLWYGEFCIIFFRDNSTYFEFDNCDIRWARNGICISPWIPSTTNNWIIKNCYIRDIGVRSPDSDAHAVGVQSTYNGIIEGCEMTNAGSTIVFYLSSGEEIKDCIVRWNYIHDPHHLCSNGRGIAFNLGKNQTIGSGTGNMIYGNIVARCADGIRSQFHDEVQIYNNVVIDSDANNFLINRYDYQIRCVLKNNISMFTNWSQGKYHIFYRTGASEGNDYLKSDYNLFYPVDSNDCFRYDDLSGSSVTLTYSEWQARNRTDCIWDPNSKINNPELINESGSFSQDTDFEISSSSPAINAGVDVGLTQDYIGTPIPQGSAPDIGAFEIFKPLFANITNPNDGFRAEVGQTINFTGEASGDNPPPYTFSWDFGDGGSSSEQNPSHIYTNAGIYTVNLTVTDSQGIQDTDSITIKLRLGLVPAYLACSPLNLYFGYSISGDGTEDQSLRIVNAGSGSLTWSLTDDAGWLSLSPASGTGRGDVTVSVNGSGLPAGLYTATVTVSSPEAYNSPQVVAVDLRVYEADEDLSPFGSFDTPEDGSTVAGSIPLSGWALDDIKIQKVEIKRDAVFTDTSEAIDSDGLVLLGEAIFIDGARPDKENEYFNYPLSSRAGWGYMLNTTSLPNRGNGYYTIYAFAQDTGGKKVEIGRKTIYCDNANDSKPFGNIDAPEQGEVTESSDYMTIAWTLTPLPKKIPQDGSTIWIWADGLKSGHPVHNQYREDIADMYPEYNNAQGAEGYYWIDTTQFENGMHTVVWSVEDDWGEIEGIGASYFIISEIGKVQQENSELKSRYLEDTTGRLRIGIKEIRKGYRLQIYDDHFNRETPIINEETAHTMKKEKTTIEREEISLAANIKTRIVIILPEIQIEEMEPVEISFEGGSAENITYIGWGENDMQSLPIGSTLDKKKGIFSWIPTPGFLGKYIFHFAVKDGLYISAPLKVIVDVIPKNLPQHFN